MTKHSNVTEPPPRIAPKFKATASSKGSFHQINNCCVNCDWYSVDKSTKNIKSADFLPLPQPVGHI